MSEATINTARKMLSSDLAHIQYRKSACSEPGRHTSPRAYPYPNYRRQQGLYLHEPRFGFFRRADRFWDRDRGYPPAGKACPLFHCQTAGEILQKYINYGGRIAVYGDYSRYTSKPLKDFIYGIAVPPHTEQLFPPLIEHFYDLLRRVAVGQIVSGTVIEDIHHTSKPLKDFIYESNKGRDVFFVSTEEEAVQVKGRLHVRNSFCLSAYNDAAYAVFFFLCKIHFYCPPFIFYLLDKHDKEYLSGRVPVLKNICNEMYVGGTLKLDGEDFRGCVITDTASGFCSISPASPVLRIKKSSVTMFLSIAIFFVPAS